MSGEVELFELGNVLVTDKAFYVLHRSFPLQSISDVEVIYHPRNWMPVVAPLFAALSFELAALSMHKSSLYLGVLVCMLVTAAAFWKGGLRYTIALETAAGHIQPMTSSNRIMVESLQQVLGSAVRRAHQQAAAHASTHAPVFRILAGKAQSTAEATETAVAGRRPVLVPKKAAQSVHSNQAVHSNQVRPYAVGRNSMRKLAAAGSSI